MKSFGDAIAEFPIVAWCQETLHNVHVGESEITADCPFCGGHRKFRMSRNTKLCICFRCKDGGHAIGWPGYGNLFKLLIYLGMPRKEAFQYICNRSGMPDVEIEIKAIKHSQPLIPKGVIPLSRLPDYEPAAQFLRRRHVPQLIRYSGVALEGVYKDRVALQCLYDGVTVGSEMKSLHKFVRPKSLFHPAGQFQKNRTVYTNLEWDPNRKEAVVTESILDAETFRNVNAIGLYGCHLSELQVVAILALGIERLIWALDGDAFLKVIQNYNLTRDHFDNSVVYFNQKDDPNSVGPDGCASALKSCVDVKSEWDLYACGVEWNKWYPS